MLEKSQGGRACLGLPTCGLSPVSPDAVGVSTEDRRSRIGSKYEQSAKTAETLIASAVCADCRGFLVCTNGVVVSLS